MIRYALAFLAILLTGLPGASRAETPPGPSKVVVGTYVNQITGVNLRDNQVNVDFYVWFRWDDDSLNPLETFELMNGRIESRTPTPVRKLKDTNYGQARVQAVLNQPWDVSRFPLDTQTIRLVIEDSDQTAEYVVYVPDTDNSTVDPDVDVSGYTLINNGSTISAHHYRTNYGDITLPKNHESVYSRYTHAITLERPDSVYYIKTFSTIFISSLVAFLAFLVKPVDLDPRFGLGIGALFAVVACYFVIASDLPRSSGFTLSDRVNLASMGMIFLSLMQSAVSLMIYERNAAKALILDRWSLVIFPVAYALLCVWLTTV
ncbi:hypothetical protein Sp245p_14645 (plasmid) [Azospirillum baldaniorum]|uniref:Neurotransmitter-gated ion-channel ligand-binding domain-containing protein n=1 Tax=Azospirillum baldaniorum TaxID=1064539 RepID=A0A9P1JWF8_9PROT|nr:hypothetical protein [Azospirillum baldaniorum]TWA72327.1 hypothetical protein FBZ85_1199 [Azospirillum brasilense]AWJ91109.1 hypothetical protein Sp245p_14645 [Azospirillum baldaniorum]NUB10569.1 hypothetical protein [Azospirillum baldaniorum]TWA57960.1 hypothetical protein FBZ84_1199 [Azospirillum baldaniorum]CCD01136.1 membrane protein of unknown function [Azospirillum baldaniorum]